MPVTANTHSRINLLLNQLVKTSVGRKKIAVSFAYVLKRQNLTTSADVQKRCRTLLASINKTFSQETEIILEMNSILSSQE